MDSADSPFAKPVGFLRYPKQSLNLKNENGSFTKTVKIVHAVDPSTFYCQLAENLDYFQIFMERLNAAYTGEKYIWMNIWRNIFKMSFS